MRCPTYVGFFIIFIKPKHVPMLESESLEKAKQNFIQSNERFVSAINKITIDNYKSVEQKLLLSPLHIQAIEKYSLLMELIGVIKLNG